MVSASQTAADDPCRPQRLALDQEQQFFAGDIVKGAVIGAGVGALTGFLAGGSNRAQSALIGGAAGAAAGGLAGYWVSQQNQGGSRTDLISRMVGDMDKEQAALDKTQVAFNQLVDCRKNSARQVNTDLSARTITRPEADARMARVRELAAQDIQIAKQINAKLDERTGNFTYAAEQVTGAPIQVAAAEPPPPPPPPPARTNNRTTARNAPPPPPPTQVAAAPKDPVTASATTLVQKKQSFAQSTAAAETDMASLSVIPTA